MTITIFILLRALPAWLALPRSDRDDIAEKAMASSGLAASGALRLYDCEAFTARCSDMAVVETTDLQGFYFAMERLRDSPLFAVPYFELIDILPGIENGFRQFAEGGR